MKALDPPRSSGCSATSASRSITRAGEGQPSWVVPVAIDQECHILVWSPLAGGLLSGEVPARQGAPPGAARGGLG